MINQITLACYLQGSVWQFINSQTWCVCELYASFLEDYDTGKIVKCNININDDWGNLNNQYQKFADVITIKLNFDFAHYQQLSTQEMKRMQLDVLHGGMITIAQKEGWNLDMLLDAYTSCIKLNLEYKFALKKGKLISSPNRKYKIGFWCICDVDKCEISYVLLDKRGIELKRQHFMTCNAANCEFVYYTNWKWLDNASILFQDNYKYGDGDIIVISIND